MTIVVDARVGAGEEAAHVIIVVRITEPPRVVGRAGDHAGPGLHVTGQRGEVLEVAAIFKAVAVDVGAASIAFQVAGTPGRSTTSSTVRPYGIVDLVKSGRTCRPRSRRSRGCGRSVNRRRLSNGNHLVRRRRRPVDHPRPPGAVIGYGARGMPMRSTSPSPGRGDGGLRAGSASEPPPRRPGSVTTPRCRVLDSVVLLVPDQHMGDIYRPTSCRT